MEYLFHISKENEQLPQQEVLSLYEIKKYTKIAEGFISLKIAEDRLQLYQKLAYTNEVYKMLFSSTEEKSIIEKIKEFDWKNVYKENFAIRVVILENERDIAHSIQLRQKKEREFVGIIYQQLQNPTVNLKNPQTSIVFFFCKNKIYCCLRLWQNDKSFMLRKPHLKPELHPTSLNPRLAKACINLVVTKSDYYKTFAGAAKVLLDPFCGVGGILVEAGLLGIKTIGVDNQQKMIDACRENVDYYGINDCTLLVDDATKITPKKLGLSAGKITAIVTDLPYGKNTKKVQHEKLYRAFLKNACKLTDTMVVMFPDFFNSEKLLKQFFTIKKKFTIYLHKSLSKKIFLVGRK